jgi:hypothetical protein
MQRYLQAVGTTSLTKAAAESGDRGLREALRTVPNPKTLDASEQRALAFNISEMQKKATIDATQQAIYAQEAEARVHEDADMDAIGRANARAAVSRGQLKSREATEEARARAEAHAEAWSRANARAAEDAADREAEDEAARVRQGDAIAPSYGRDQTMGTAPGGIARNPKSMQYPQAGGEEAEWAPENEDARDDETEDEDAGEESTARLMEMTLARLRGAEDSRGRARARQAGSTSGTGQSLFEDEDARSRARAKASLVDALKAALGTGGLAEDEDENEEEDSRARTRSRAHARARQDGSPRRVSPPSPLSKAAFEGGQSGSSGPLASGGRAQTSQFDMNDWDGMSGSAQGAPTKGGMPSDDAKWYNFDRPTAVGQRLVGGARDIYKPVALDPTTMKPYSEGDPARVSASDARTKSGPGGSGDDGFLKDLPKMYRAKRS